MLTEKEKKIVNKLNHPLFTVEYLEKWITRNENVFIKPEKALCASEAKGFFEAVKAIEDTFLEGE